jgi:hypothetical protein
MSVKLFNLARMTTATTGTGAATLGVAVAGYLTFAQAGVGNGDAVFYGIKDGSNSEIGIGTYSSAGPTLTRSGVYKSTNSNALISLSGSAEVYLTVAASDGGDLIPGFSNPLRGFDTPINLQLGTSVAANALTITVTGNNGAAPSNSNPILIPFRDASASPGPNWRFVNSALSLTLPNSATLGAANGVPFRIWIVAIDNGGTVVLGAFQSVTGGASPTAIGPLNEGVLATTIATGATPGVIYTPSGALTSKPIRIVGYLDYGSGLTTAGAYATGPTLIQLFGPGIKLPGEIVQRQLFNASCTSSTTSTTLTSTTTTKSITPTASPNLINCSYAASGVVAGPGVQAIAQLQRVSGINIGGRCLFQANGTVAALIGHWGLMNMLDAPGTTSSTTYTLFIANNDGATTVNVTTWATLSLEEIMV